MERIPKLRRIEFVEDNVIRGHLDDGTVRDLDFADVLDGPMLEPLRDPELFRRASVDDTGILVWPNGADIAPEAWVRGWADQSEAAPATTG